MSRVVLAECPGGWFYYKADEMCFYASSEAMTRSEAISECESMDAEMASITSYEEMTWFLGIA